MSKPLSIFLELIGGGMFLGGVAHGNLGPAFFGAVLICIGAWGIRERLK